MWDDPKKKFFWSSWGCNPVFGKQCTSVFVNLLDSKPPHRRVCCSPQKKKSWTSPCPHGWQHTPPKKAEPAGRAPVRRLEICYTHCSVKKDDLSPREGRSSPPLCHRTCSLSWTASAPSQGVVPWSVKAGDYYEGWRLPSQALAATPMFLLHLRTHTPCFLTHRRRLQRRRPKSPPRPPGWMWTLREGRPLQVRGRLTSLGQTSLNPSCSYWQR